MVHIFADQSKTAHAMASKLDKLTAATCPLIVHMDPKFQTSAAKVAPFGFSYANAVVARLAHWLRHSAALIGEQTLSCGNASTVALW